MLMARVMLKVDLGKRKRSLRDTGRGDRASKQFPRSTPEHCRRSVRLAPSLFTEGKRAHCLFLFVLFGSYSYVILLNLSLSPRSSHHITPPPYLPPALHLHPRFSLPLITRVGLYCQIRLFVVRFREMFEGRRLRAWMAIPAIFLGQQKLSADDTTIIFFFFWFNNITIEFHVFFSTGQLRFFFYLREGNQK